MTTCTECGATVPPDKPVCPRCHHPKWYTLKKVGLCLVVIVILVVAIKVMVTTGDRSLRQWFG